MTINLIFVPKGKDKFEYKAKLFTIEQRKEVNNYTLSMPRSTGSIGQHRIYLNNLTGMHATAVDAGTIKTEIEFEADVIKDMGTAAQHTLMTPRLKPKTRPTKPKGH